MDLLFLGRSSLVSCGDRGKEHNLRIKTDDSQLERILWKHDGWLTSLGHRYRHTLQCISKASTTLHTCQLDFHVYLVLLVVISTKTMKDYEKH